MKSKLLLLLFFPFALFAQEGVIQTPPPSPNVVGEGKGGDAPTDFPDVEAEFPGGLDSMQRFISDNVEYPKEAIEANEMGKVYLSFVVEVDGSITMIQVERGASSSLDAEAMRLVSIMPNWKPGEAAGKKVRTRCRLPINFTLDNTDEPAPPIQYTSAYADASPEDAKAIKDVFAAYKMAMLSDLGAEVSKYVDQNTVDYYTYILEQARYAAASDISDLGLVHQLSVLLLRHTSSAKEVEKMNGKGLLAYLINNKRIGKGGLEDNVLSVIKSDGSVAQAYIFENGKETSQYFLFHKEQGFWKIDLTTHFDSMQRLLENYMDQARITERELILQLLEQVNGEKPDPKIWEPMVK